MRASVLVLAVVAVAMAKPAPPARSRQEKLLEKQNTGNFACKVNAVKVSTDNPGDGKGVTNDHVKAAFKSVNTIEWAHVPQTSFTAMDGRNPEKVLASPGGDMGEFIQAVMSYAKVSGTELDQRDVDGMFLKYLKTTTREKFSYETDERAYLRMAVAVGCKNLRISDMEGARRKMNDLTAVMGNPDFIGDPFIKFLATNATDLDIDGRYIQMGLTAYHTVLWNGPVDMAAKLCYTEVKGLHQEAALVTIKVPSYCIDQGLAPMVSQQMTCSNPVYAHHPDAVKLLRRELVACLTEGQQVDARDMLAAYNLMADSNFATWWGSIGEGKSSFTVEFSHTHFQEDEEEQ